MAANAGARMKPRESSTLARARTQVFGRLCPSYQVCGVAGLAAALGLGGALTASRGLSWGVLALMACVACLTVPAMTLVAQWAAGEERIVYYHHAIAICALCAAMLAVLRQPVLVYLDILIVGVGSFLAFGRIGCLMVGCCHGAPWRWGIRYGEEHVRDGFDRSLRGVPLFPVQAMESAWVAGVTAVSAWIVWKGMPAGTAVAAYFVGYGIGRFGLEFFRGDSCRKYVLGFSEAQWTSLILVAAVRAAERAGALPPSGWHRAAGFGLALAFLAVAALRRLRDPRPAALLNPRHACEIAGRLCQVQEAFLESRRPAAGFLAPAPIPLYCTSLGIRISGGLVRNAGGAMEHYSISSARGRMDDVTARVLAGLIGRLRASGGPVELILAGERGTHHVLVPLHRAEVRS